VSTCAPGHRRWNAWFFTNCRSFIDGPYCCDCF